MKAKELRIGNIVEYFIGDEYEGNEWVENIIDVDDILLLSKYPDDEDYRPIPITEEWLVKFGFEKERNQIDTHDLYLFKRFSLYRIDSELWDVAKGSNYFKMAEIKYVHQLQNLIFDLTGEELTIKE